MGELERVQTKPPSPTFWGEPLYAIARVKVVPAGMVSAVPAPALSVELWLTVATAGANPDAAVTVVVAPMVKVPVPLKLVLNVCELPLSDTVPSTVNVPLWVRAPLVKVSVAPVETVTVPPA